MPPKDEAGYEATMQLLSHKNPPDGILVSNGLLGVGVYRAICESGLQCPEQIAFACFDETSWAALVRPSVTTLEQPTYEIGFTAAEMLHRRIQSPNRPPLEVLLKYQIRIRNSSAIQP
jgi:DNA-binding LacI/PurR family transcriptional regulator